MPDEPRAPLVLVAPDSFQGTFAAHEAATSTSGADAVVSGEGRLDGQSLDGKILGAIAGRAERAGVAMHAIVGTSTLVPDQIEMLGLASSFSHSTGTLPLMATARNLATCGLMSCRRPGPGLACAE